MAICAVCMVLGMTACGNRQDNVVLETYQEPDVQIANLPKETAQYFDVVFDANGHGVAPAPQSVRERDPAKDPGELTTDEGYTFIGWYADADSTQKYDFSTPVNSNTTVYAGWSKDPVYYQVKIRNDGHHQTFEPQTVLEGESAVRPADPVEDNYTFRGWYLDLEGTSAFDFASPITGDTTVYAVWDRIPDPITVQVIFDGNGADSNTFKVQSFTQRVADQQFIGDISKEGNEMLGWARSKDATEAEEEKNKVITDEWIQSVADNEGTSLILYAVWKGPKYATINPGEVGEHVTAMQEALAQLGYYTIAVDGSYGPGTEKAVNDFRVANGLPEGIADSEMQELMYSQIEAQAAAEAEAPAEEVPSE